MFHDPFLPLASAATGTSRITLGTSIALAFVRSPWVTALSALDLDILSGGRFILGLGTGLKRLNERWHGVAYGKPTPHIRECVKVIRLITERAHIGEPIRFSGQYYDVDIQGWQRPVMPVRERIPIYLAGVREGMIRTAAEVADGLLGHPIYSQRWINDVVLPSVARGLRDSARKREDFQLCLFVCCAVDNDVAAARRAAAATIAFYATVNTYEPLFAGFPREVACDPRWADDGRAGANDRRRLRRYGRYVCGRGTARRGQAPRRCLRAARRQHLPLAARPAHRARRDGALPRGASRDIRGLTGRVDRDETLRAGGM